MSFNASTPQGDSAGHHMTVQAADSIFDKYEEKLQISLRLYVLWLS